MRVIRRIILHTAATGSNGKAVHAPVSSIRRYHVDHNGWDDIGYHEYIDELGNVHNGRAWETPGAHVGGYNQHTLGFCVSGHGDLEPWGEAQTKAVVALCVRVCRDLGLKADAVIGHREASAQSDYDGGPIYKTCPGKLVDMNQIRALVREQLMAPGHGLSLEERVSRIEGFLNL